MMSLLIKDIIFDKDRLFRLFFFSREVLQTYHFLNIKGLILNVVNANRVSQGRILT